MVLWSTSGCSNPEAYELDPLDFYTSFYAAVTPLKSVKLLIVIEWSIRSLIPVSATIFLQWTCSGAVLGGIHAYYCNSALAICKKFGGCMQCATASLEYLESFISINYSVIYCLSCHFLFSFIGTLDFYFPRGHCVLELYLKVKEHSTLVLKCPFPSTTNLVRMLEGTLELSPQPSCSRDLCHALVICLFSHHSSD